MNELVTETKGGYVIDMDDGFAYYQIKENAIEGQGRPLSDKELVIIRLCQEILEVKHEKVNDYYPHAFGHRFFGFYLF